VLGSDPFTPVLGPLPPTLSPLAAAARPPPRPAAASLPLPPAWLAPPSDASLLQSLPNASRAATTLRGVHRRDGSLRPLLRPRLASMLASPTPRSLREDGPLPASYTRSSSPCDATHCPGFSSHPSTRCPTSPTPPRPLNAPPAQTPL